MTALLIFISTFSLVFALGFQSLNVNNGHYKAAFMTSFAIGLSNLALFKTVPDANWLEIVAFLSGGPFGIVCSMWAHERWMPKRDRRGKVPLPEGKAWQEPPETMLIKGANPIPPPVPERVGFRLKDFWPWRSAE